ncbi:LAETG motif-containing sortase-dependent surface protein [Streptomyces sp. NPDC014882]|uniref:LAETG motif-containing sortase-dependent surface protein n=1 Tax=Streptomyces sp. NPDC014882 TaxID=3364927 RepID=UPI0036FBD04E
MSPSLRTAARSVRMPALVAASAALVLGASGSALATDPVSIDQFSAAASCDGSKGVITVTGTEVTDTPAVVSVFLQNNNADLKRVGKPTRVKDSAEGATAVFAEQWEPDAEYRIHIKIGKFEADIDQNLTTPAKACQADATPSTPGTPGAPTTPSTPSASSTPPSDTASPPATSAAPAPSHPSTPSAPSASVSDGTVPADTASNAPSPAAQESHLAETGASSRTGLIVGVAAVLVLVGGGAVFLGMRRKGTGNR